MIGLRLEHAFSLSLQNPVGEVRVMFPLETGMPKMVENR